MKMINNLLTLEYPAHLCCTRKERQ